MAKIMEMLRIDHMHVSQLLIYMAKQSALLRDNKEFDADMMYVVMHYMIHYPDIFHHPREEKLFSLLRKHDASVIPIVEKLHDEHTELGRLGEELLSLYIASRDGKNVNIDYMQQATDSYIYLHREHMKTEETKIFPLARILLSENDLRKIDKQVKWREDPLFGEVTDTVYSVLLKTIENS